MPQFGCKMPCTLDGKRNTCARRLSPNHLPRKCYCSKPYNHKLCFNRRVRRGVTRVSSYQAMAPATVQRKVKNTCCLNAIISLWALSLAWYALLLSLIIAAISCSGTITAVVMRTIKTCWLVCGYLFQPTKVIIFSYMVDLVERRHVCV